MKNLMTALADAPRTDDLVGLLFDFVVAQPVGRFVTVDRALAHLDGALAEQVTEEALRKHLRPLLDREHARARARDDRLGDWLTAEAVAELRSLAARPVLLKRSFLEGLVSQDAVQHLLRSVVEETLDRFLQTLKPGGTGGGVFGAVGRGALGLASNFGKGLFGQLGAQLESQLRAAASAFISSSMNVMMERVVTLLASPETGAKLGRLNQTGFDEALKLKVHVLWTQVMKLPVDDLDGLIDVVPGLIAFNLARPEVRAALREELEAGLAIEGERPLRDLLSQAKTLDLWRKDVVEVASPLLREFALTPELQAWLGDRP